MKLYEVVTYDTLCEKHLHDDLYMDVDELDEDIVRAEGRTCSICDTEETS